MGLLIVTQRFRGRSTDRRTRRGSYGLRERRQAVKVRDAHGIVKSTPGSIRICNLPQFFYEPDVSFVLKG